jgi:hypothetical protein
MADLGSLTVFLNADTDNYSKGINRASRKTERFAAETQRANQIVKAGFIAAGAAILEFSRRAILASADAEEVRQKFSVVFGSIGKSANLAASEIAKSFDIANSTALEILGTTGDLLTGFGFTQEKALELSEQIATLAGDLASFQNIEGGAAEASERLTKGILGRTRSLQELGIVVRQDTDEFRELVKELMEVEGLTILQAKAQVILNKSMEQSKNAIGDYARTSGSLVNQLRALWEGLKDATVGFGDVLNAILPAKSGIRLLADTFRDLGGGLRAVSEDLNLLLKGIDRNAEASSQALDVQIAKQRELNLARGAVKVDIKKTFDPKETGVGPPKEVIPGLAEFNEANDKIVAQRKKDEEDLARIRARIQFKFDQRKHQMRLKREREVQRFREGVERRRQQLREQFRSLPKVAPTIRAGTTAALALRSQGTTRSTFALKLSKKNATANIDSNRVLRDAATNGWKLKDVKVVDNIARS